MELQEIIDELTIKSESYVFDDQNFKATILFSIQDNILKHWQAIIENGKITIKSTDDQEADLKISATSETVIGLYQKKINPMMAFLTRKIKVKGDAALISKAKSMLFSKK